MSVVWENFALRTFVRKVPSIEQKNRPASYCYKQASLGFPAKWFNQLKTWFCYEDILALDKTCTVESSFKNFLLNKWLMITINWHQLGLEQKTSNHFLFNSVKCRQHLQDQPSSYATPTDQRSRQRYFKYLIFTYLIFEYLIFTYFALLKPDLLWQHLRFLFAGQSRI